MRAGRLVFPVVLFLLSGGAPLAAQAPDDFDQQVTQGALRIKTRAGRVVECPLRHTDVQAEISGFVARVRVTQQFVNPGDDPIEAVYVFPLPHEAAVDDMSMVVGQRRIVGIVKRRLEAREIYERAVAAGLTASLLKQERPNLFTQTVGNIPPGQEVRIEISYVDVLAYDRGTYEFHFPMVVGPRYIPGRPLDREPTGEGWAPDTGRVPDASRITPPVLKPGERTGHDLSLSVRLEAGVPVRDLQTPSHQAKVERTGRSTAQLTLSPADAIPNKDFVLRYAVAGTKPEVALLTHAPRGEDGYFLLMMQPRQMEDELREAPPREICFLVDVSGSMSGAPTAKVVETMRLLLGRIRPQDNLQVVTFASGTDRLFPGYVPATPANVARALGFTDGLRGGGGPEMPRGIRAVLAEPVAGERIRIVVMLTDGFIGNETQIIREVARRSGDRIRFWAVGVGTSVNRYLIDGVGRQGGLSAVLGLSENPAPLVARIADRLSRAQLGQIDIDWGGHAVYETYPARIPDLWAGSPVVVVGRYRTNGPGTIQVSNRAKKQAVSFPLAVQLPSEAADHAVLAKVWARRKIEDLSEPVASSGNEIVEEITDLALRYRLMSAYTSFVAVDESEAGGLLHAPRPPRRVTVPVPLPEGVSYEGVFGTADAPEQALYARARRGQAAVMTPSAPRAARAPLASSSLFAADDGTTDSEDLGVEGGVGGGVAGGVAGGVVAGIVGGAPALAPPLAPPAPPPASMSLAMSMEEMNAVVARWTEPSFQAFAMADRVSRSSGGRPAEAAAALANGRAMLEKGDHYEARRLLRRAWVLGSVR